MIRPMLTLAGAALLALLLHLIVPVAGTTGKPAALEAIDENPAERAYWEHRQLRDPRTDRIPRGIRQLERSFAATIPAREGKGSRLAGADAWRSRGPSNVGGRTRALAFDLDDPNTLLAGGVTGGVWKSTDRGSSWRRTTRPDQLPSVTCIAQDPRPGYRDVWYYGTGEGRTNSERFGNTPLIGDGIFRSTDNGESWSQLPSTISATPQSLDSPFDIVWNIVVDTTEGAAILYAAVKGGIMRSTDDGTTWRAVLGEGNSSLFSTVVRSAGGFLYAGLSSGNLASGIWRSVNGLTWEEISPPQLVDSIRRTVLATSPSDPGRLYVLQETPGRGMTIQGSYGFPESYQLWQLQEDLQSAAGYSWVDLTNSLPLNYNSLHSYAMMLAVDPRDADVVYLGGTNLYRTSDGFASRSTVTWLGGYGPRPWYEEGALHPDQHVVTFDPLDPDTLYSGSDGGVTRAYVGSSLDPEWERRNDGYVTAQLYTVALDHATAGSGLMLAGLQDNGTQIVTGGDTLSPWEMVAGGDGAFCAVVDGGRHLVASAQYGNMFVIETDQSGEPTGVEQTHIPANRLLFISPFTLDPSESTTLYAAGGSRLLRYADVSRVPELSDGGWSSMTSSPDGAVITAIGVSRREPAHRLYFGTDAGRLFRIKDASDAGDTAVEVTGAEFPSGGYINCVAVDPEDADRLLVVFTNYNVRSLFLSEDGGESWRSVGGNLEERPDGSGAGPSCRWARFVTVGGVRRLYVGTTVGLFSTTSPDGEATEWVREGAESIGNVRVDMIDARENDGVVAVATWGRGLFTTTLQASSVAAPIASSSPLSVTPNVIGRGESAVVRGEGKRVDLYDQLGRKLRSVELVDGEGRFDAGDLAAGRYLLRGEGTAAIVVR